MPRLKTDDDAFIELRIMAGFALMGIIQPYTHVNKGMVDAESIAEHAVDIAEATIKEIEKREAKRDDT